MNEGSNYQLGDGDTDHSYRWWLEADEEEELLACLWPSYERFCRLESNRLYDHRRYNRLYGVREHRPDPWELGFEPDRIQLNVIKSCVDSATAKIGKQRPRPKPLTDGGNASLTRKARNLQRYLDAQFRIGRYYVNATDAFRDAALTGTGHLAIYQDGTQVRFQRVLSDEVLVDPTEARFGDPRTMFRRRWVSRDTLANKFPKRADAIYDSQAAPPGDWTVPGEARTGDDRTDDMVLLVEAIHLPSTSTGGDGLRVLCLRDCVLAVSPWTYDYFPIVRVHWTRPVTGYWGHGLAEELYGIQIEINRILQKLQAAMHLVAVPRIFVPIGAKIQAPQFDNRVGAIIPYSGTQVPTFHTAQAASADMYQHLWALYNKAFEISGLTHLSDRAYQAAPTSAIGQQTRHDIESERFSIAAQEYERLSIDAAYQAIDRARELAKRNRNYAAPAARDKYSVERVDWSEVDMAADEYELAVMPTSALPNDASGRQTAVESMLNTGLVNPTEAREMLDFPDLEQHLALDRAASELIDTLVERMLDEGEYYPPEPFFDLNLALKKCQAHYNRALLRRDVPDDRLQLLRDFMAQTFIMVQRAQQQEAMQNQAIASQNQPTPQPGSPPAPGVRGAPPTAVAAGDGVPRG